MARQECVGRKQELFQAVPNESAEKAAIRMRLKQTAEDQSFLAAAWQKRITAFRAVAENAAIIAGMERLRVLREQLSEQLEGVTADDALSAIFGPGNDAAMERAIARRPNLPAARPTGEDVSHQVGACLPGASATVASEAESAGAASAAFPVSYPIPVQVPYPHMQGDQHNYQQQQYASGGQDPSGFTSPQPAAHATPGTAPLQQQQQQQPPLQAPNTAPAQVQQQQQQQQPRQRQRRNNRSGSGRGGRASGGK
jgi:hypothetical protein